MLTGCSNGMAAVRKRNPFKKAGWQAGYQEIAYLYTVDCKGTQFILKVSLYMRNNREIVLKPVNLFYPILLLPLILGEGIARGLYFYIY